MIINQSEFRNIKPQAQEAEPKEKKLSLSLSLMILGAMLDAPFTLRRKRFKTEFLLWKQINCFPFTLRRNFEKQQSPVILNFCPCNTRAGNGCRDAIVFEKLRFKLKCFPFTLKCKAAVSKFLPIKSVFEKLLFRDGLAWTVVLAEEIKLRCQIPPV